MGLFSWARKRNTDIKATAIQHAPLPVLKGLYSDSEREKWASKRERMAKAKANAASIYADRAQFEHDRAAISLASAAFGYGKVALDKDVSLVRKAIAQRANQSNAQAMLDGTCDVETRIRGLLGGY